MIVLLEPLFPTQVAAEKSEALSIRIYVNG